MKFHSGLQLLIFCCLGFWNVLVATAAVCQSQPLSVLRSLRCGYFEAAKNQDKYFKQFPLDYGIEDTKRQAGQLRGLVANGKLTKLPHKDQFIKWLCKHLEAGPNLHKEKYRFKRIKPFFVRFTTIFRL
jgi:hypothetical protein